jgi:hypothetical protein
MTNDERIELLPEPFKKRIHKFRKNNLTYQKTFESYELDCCEAAVLIHGFARGNRKMVNEFHQMTEEERMAFIPQWNTHLTVNQIKCACALASWYIADPESVVLLDGALTPIVGPEEYGDINKA